MAQVLQARSALPATALHLAAASVAVVSYICSEGDYFAAASMALVTVAALVLITAQTGAVTLSRAVQMTLVFWFVASPLLSFYVRFPEEKSLLTFDRLVLGGLAVSLIVAWWRSSASQKPAGLPLATARGAELAPDGTPSNSAAQPRSYKFSLTSFEVSWLVLTVVATASALSKSNHLGFAGRTAIDAFALPLVAFYLARRHLNVEGCRRAILVGAALLAFFLLATGAYELVGTDLFQVKGSEIIRGQETRVNGPFSSDSSFAIISLLVAILLRAAPSVLKLKLRGAARSVYYVAVAAAVVASLLPAYRGVAIALLVAWVAYEVGVAGFLTRRRSGASGMETRAIVGARAIALGGVLALMLAGIVALSPALFERRLVSPGNFFSRIATWEGAVRVTLDNPLFGVGLWNFTEHFETYYRDAWSPVEIALDTRITSGPHSNVLWIASELGLVGLIPYLAANLFLLIMSIRVLRTPTSPQRIAGAACFLALLVGYWVSGLALVSGIYSDLNLYFFFLLGLLSRVMSDRSNRGSAGAG